MGWVAISPPHASFPNCWKLLMPPPLHLAALWTSMDLLYREGAHTAVRPVLGRWPLHLLGSFGKAGCSEDSLPWLIHEVIPLRAHQFRKTRGVCVTGGKGAKERRESHGWQMEREAEGELQSRITVRIFYQLVAKSQPAQTKGKSKKETRETMRCCYSSAPMTS